jgi:hypothetical protein
MRKSLLVVEYYLDCLLFLLIRLDPTADGEDIQLIRDLFDGGEARRMGPSSVAVQIEKRILLNDYTPDTFHYWQSGDHAVTVQIFQSLQAGEILSCEAMDAMLQLFINRDQQMCEAYVQVNEKKPGYIQRLESMYVKSFFSSKLKRDHPIADMLREPQIAFCVEKQFFLKPYRCIMPLLWDAKNEWILIVIEASVRAVQIIYPKYVSNVAQSSSGDERVAYSIVLREILFAILSASETAQTTNVACHGIVFVSITLPVQMTVLKAVLIIVYQMVWIVVSQTILTVGCISYTQSSAIITTPQYLQLCLMIMIIFG